MKNLTLIIACLFISTFSMAQTNFHSFTVTDIDGNTFDMSQLKGKKVMVVNTASEGNLTPQYAELQDLYEKYNTQNFVVIAFPSNDFNSEPRTDEEIKQFCTTNYGITFPIMASVSVKGATVAPIYRWLTHKVENGVEDVKAAWNFHKFLIDEDGNWYSSISSRRSPLDDEVIKWIEAK